jgi:TPR repeat protein
MIAYAFVRYYYEMGVGVPADYPRALEYYGKAATKGHEAAAAALNRNDSDSQGNGNGITKVVHHGNHNKHVVDRHSKNSKDCAVM